MNSPTIRGHVVTEDHVLHNHEIIVEDGEIQSITPIAETSNDKQFPYILPGFRDQHVHDWAGQTMASTANHEANMERFQQVMKLFVKHGVTGVYLATFGGPLHVLEHYCQAARGWMDHADNGRTGTKLEGLHIEGTFLNDECRGAQPAEYCLIPTRDNCIEALDRLHGTGAMRIVNIVPDYGDASLQTIRHASDLGVLVGSGHTKTTANLLKKAYEDCGLKFMVHFTNGPTGQSFKPFDGGGAFEGAINLPIHKELIIDRTHIDERYVLDIIRQTEERWGTEKIIAVTDALFPDLHDLPDEEFTIGTTVARPDPTGQYMTATSYVQPDGSRLPAPPNTLCSSIISMDRVFSNLVNLFTQTVQGHWYEHPALSLDDALVKAARFCSAHQAMLDGSYEKTGSIAAGKKADLVVGAFENTGKESRLQIKQVYIDGIAVWRNET